MVLFFSHLACLYEGRILGTTPSKGDYKKKTRKDYWVFAFVFFCVRTNMQDVRKSIHTFPTFHCSFVGFVVLNSTDCLAVSRGYLPESLHPISFEEYLNGPILACLLARGTR